MDPNIPTHGPGQILFYLSCDSGLKFLSNILTADVKTCFERLKVKLKGICGVYISLKLAYSLLLKVSFGIIRFFVILFFIRIGLLT